MFSLDIYTIRSRYTTPGNACKPVQIRRLAEIAIAHDIASLVGEVEELRNHVAKLNAEIEALRSQIPTSAEPR